MPSIVTSSKTIARPGSTAPSQRWVDTAIPPAGPISARITTAISLTPTNNRPNAAVAGDYVCRRVGARRTTRSSRSLPREPPLSISRGRGRKLCEEIHHVVVGVDDLRIALTPERVPRILLRAKSSAHDARVRCVDLSGRGTLERQTHAVSLGIDPVGIELLDQLERVPHEANAAREGRVEVVVGSISHVDAQHTVKAHRLLHVAGHDPDGGEGRHESRLVPRARRRERFPTRPCPGPLCRGHGDTRHPQSRTTARVDSARPPRRERPRWAF